MDSVQRIIIINQLLLQARRLTSVLKTVINYNVLFYYFMLAAEVWLRCRPLGKYKVFELCSRERAIEASG